MHFLCLHGMGSNNKILEMQLAAFRYELGDEHTFDYAEGILPFTWPAEEIPTSIDPVFRHEVGGTQAFELPEDTTSFSWASRFHELFPGEESFAYFDPSSPESILKSVDDLTHFLAEEGPFDGLIGRSHGATLAATLLARSSPGLGNSASNTAVKCAIFLGGGPPYDTRDLAKGCIREFTPESDGEVIHIPTANIWGANDVKFGSLSENLSRLCKSGCNSIFLHDVEHDLPDLRTRRSLLGAVHAVQRTVRNADHRH